MSFVMMKSIVSGQSVAGAEQQPEEQKMKMINVDFLLSGCSTRCRHCYVAGGPGPMMETGDALLCIK